MTSKDSRAAAGGPATRTIMTALVMLLMTGCSNQQATNDDEGDALADGTQRVVDVDEREMADEGLTKAQRLYDVSETPGFPANNGDEHQRSGIFSSFRKGVLQLNEAGQVHSYPLAHDVVVHYPGGVTGLSDLRQGDKVTLILEPRNSKDGTPEIGSEEVNSNFVVKRIDKHTESVDRK